MSTSGIRANLSLIKAVLSNPGMFRVRPAVLRFLMEYTGRFKIRNVEGMLVLHSHLPPLNSKAYGRFVNEHLVAGSRGPSHAQIGVTDQCPQNCPYCYNRGKTGRLLDTEAVVRLIRELKSMGVFWLGLTGGEPLMQRDIVDIVHAIGPDCASKLFTTGAGLTLQRAKELRGAGLNYVSVSLDHWDPKIHDAARGGAGSFDTALRALQIFRAVGGIHVSVSVVLPPNMVAVSSLVSLLTFLETLNIHEAWISEQKPANPQLWHDGWTITEGQRESIMSFQDRYNKTGPMTVNYLGHFEDGERFGCNAGHKMIHIDAFGDVAPCVFTPLSFGNVMEAPISRIFEEMTCYFPSADTCFINKHYAALERVYGGILPISGVDLHSMMQGIANGPLPRFNRLLRS